MVEIEIVKKEEDTTAPLVKDNMLVPCKNSKCCGKFLFYANQGEQKVLLPLTKAHIKTELRGALAVTCVELSYVNPSKENPLECTYTFPIEKTSVLSEFTATFDDKVIKTQVKDKEQATEVYEDAMAGGHGAVIAERKKKDEVLTVKLGNLLPGQTAVLKSTILSQTEIVAGSYFYALPAAYFPDYKKHGNKDKDAFGYEFSYEARIFSDSKICNLSVPQDAEITYQNDSKTEITVKSEKAGRSNDLYYRTIKMIEPELQYARIEGSDKVAVSASLVPTFDPVQPQDFFEVVKDEKPEQVKLSNGADFHFIFIVDRSGSMGCNNRMELANDALALFIRSLPKDSSFSLISFGSSYEASTINNQTVITYNDNSKEAALEQIKGFSADFGGTEILQPLQFAQQNLLAESLESAKQKRIFLLTDGSVSSPDQVIEQARSHKESVRVFSIGLGEGCDTDLVTKVASAGRGTSTIVRDNDPNLNGLVIRALSNAMEVSLRDTSYGFNGDQTALDIEVYRNTLIYDTRLMTIAEFEALNFHFKATEEKSKETLDLTFKKDDFREVTGQAAQMLFKKAVYGEIESDRTDETQKKAMSIEHQVLCDLTAIVGVSKQKEQATGMLIETQIKFGKESLNNNNNNLMMFGAPQPRMRMMMRGGPPPPMMCGMAMSPPPMMCAMAMPAPPQAQMMSDFSAAPMAPMMNMAAPVIESFDVSYATPDTGFQRSSSPMMAMQCRSSSLGDEKQLNEEDDSEAFEDFQEMKQEISPPQIHFEKRDIQMQVEEVKEVVVKTSSVQEVLSGKPDLNKVLSGQTSNGNWSSSSQAVLAACIDGENIQDEQINQALSQFELEGGADRELVYLTLLAWYILREAFADSEDEWQLIVDKAKDWLEAAGVSKPANLVKQFTLALID